MSKSSLDTIIAKIKAIISDIRENEVGHIGFLIGTTSSSADNQTEAYMTPVRKINGGNIFGVVVYSQTEAIIISHEIDGLVDAFFVDAEKKLPLVFNPNYDLLEHYGLAQYKSANAMEYGNISSVCAQIIKKSEYFQYKANDISVDAVWHYLVLRFKELSGKRFVIYGSGNIGNKIALKLVESGANVTMLSKHPEKANVIVNAINMIKNRHVLSNVQLSHQPLHAAVNADGVIGCTNNVQVVTAEMVKVMNSNGVVIDLGKGTIFDNAIEECLTRGIDTWRVDITAMLSGLVMNNYKTQDLIQLQYGRLKMASDLFFVSGGYIGKKYDVIVDNIHSPKIVFGICNSPGNVMYKHDKTAAKKLAEAHQIINKLRQ